MPLKKSGLVTFISETGGVPAALKKRSQAIPGARAESCDTGMGW